MHYKICLRKTMEIEEPIFDCDSPEEAMNCFAAKMDTDMNLYFQAEPAARNTAMEYLYRDADNYKTRNRVVLVGEINEDQISEILAARSEGLYFIPAQVGLPEERDFEPSWEYDHVWFELNECAFSSTEEPPTVSLSVDELTSNFKKAFNGWNIAQAIVRLFGSDEEINS